MRFLPTYAQTDDFIHLIDFEKRFLWIINDDGIPVGFFDFEIENTDRGYFVIYLAEEFRRKGLATTALQNALQFTELKKVKMIEGGVEKDNESSRKMMEKAGFAYSYTDEDGMLMYTLAIA
jgi:RimJ/RimL family protein N-acetyltransferase